MQIPFGGVSQILDFIVSALLVQGELVHLGRSSLNSSFGAAAATKTKSNHLYLPILSGPTWSGPTDTLAFGEFHACWAIVSKICYCLYAAFIPIPRPAPVPNWIMLHISASQASVEFGLVLPSQECCGYLPIELLPFGCALACDFPMESWLLASSLQTGWLTPFPTTKLTICGMQSPSFKSFLKVFRCNMHLHSTNPLPPSQIHEVHHFCSTHRPLKQFLRFSSHLVFLPGFWNLGESQVSQLLNPNWQVLRWGPQAIKIL